MAVDVLIVSATPPEQRGLRSHLGDRLDGQIRSLHVVAKAVGIGLGVAGAATAGRIVTLQPRAVIHLGTCGIFPGLDQYRPYDVIVASKISLLDHAVAAQKASYPEPMQTELTTHGMLSAGLAATGNRTSLAPVACPLSTTIDDALAAAVPQWLGAHAENLEAFAVAHACHLAQVPFAIMLGATHMVGSRAKEDWRQFERQSTLAAAEVLTTWMLNGAQGLPHG